MKVLTYGQLPEFAEFAGAFCVADGMSEDGLYEIALPYGGADYQNLDTAGLLIQEHYVYDADDTETAQPRYKRSESRQYRHCVFYNAQQLYRLCENLVELWNVDSDLKFADWAGDFASSIMITLGFEWI